MIAICYVDEPGKYFYLSFVTALCYYVSAFLYHNFFLGVCESYYYSSRFKKKKLVKYDENSSEYEWIRKNERVLEGNLFQAT